MVGFEGQFVETGRSRSDSKGLAGMNIICRNVFFDYYEDVTVCDSNEEAPP